MNKHEIMSLIESIVEDTHIAVLSTVDQDGAPHSRWVTPGCIEERAGAVFMISSSRFSKIDHIRSNPRAELLFQTKALDQVLNVNGRVNLLDNPSIRAETLECIGKNLHPFWRINQPENELIVLEFIIDEVTLYLPQKGTRVTINFSSEA